MAVDDLHIVGVANNTLWHTIFFADGTCQEFFGNVDSQESNPGSLGTLSDVGCAADGANTLHVVTATSTGLWHTFRQASGKGGSWQSAFGYVNGQESNPSQPGTFQQVSAAAGATMLQMTLNSSSGGPWHTIRSQGGSWSPSFDDISGQVAAFQYSSTTGCVSDAEGNLYVIGNYNYQPSGNGALVRAVRYAPSGAWPDWSTWQPGQGDTPGGSISTLSVTITGTQLADTVLCVGEVNTNGAGLFAYYYAMQRLWQGWHPLPSSGAPQNMLDVSCAYLSNGDLVFVVVADSSNPAVGQGLFTIRLVRSTNQWTPWESINDQMSNGSQVGAFSKVGISAVTTA